MTLSTHVLDAARGRPAAAVPVRWEVRAPDGTWTVAATGVTDRDGRVGAAGWRVTGSGEAVLIAGRHRLVFDVEAWADGTSPDRASADSPSRDGAEPFFPEVTITFAVARAQAGTHHHVPLLLSPYAYSTYRGS